jgi:hypothetical protein
VDLEVTNFGQMENEALEQSLHVSEVPLPHSIGSGLKEALLLSILGTREQ